ncbi:MAG: DUF4350 domain-containing protein [Thermoguttaceae bacterium]
MMRFWIGTALLAGSWLFGLDYFYPANPWVWFASLAAAVALLSQKPSDATLAVLKNRSSAIAALLLLPVVWYADWPYRAAPLLIVLALAAVRLPLPRRRLDAPASGATLAGLLMFVQWLTLELYANATACSHNLPDWVASLLSGVASLLGIDAAADGSTVVMHSMRQPHRLAVTWELLLDPATLLFFVGGAVLLLWRRGPKIVKRQEPQAIDAPPADVPDASSPTAESSADSLLHSFRALAIVLVCWIPVRTGLLMAVYLQRVLRSDPDRPLHAMNHCFSPWILLILLVVPVLLAWRFVRIPVAISEEETTSGPEPSSCRCASRAPLLIALAVALVTAAVDWCPVGSRRDGRVMVVERHSNWEPTNAGYDTLSFGEPSGYNYTAIYDYLSQYYQMSRLTEKDKIDEKTLAGCDVLILKTPTVRYSPDEVKAVQQFVQRGGGLLLVGDHTNFERSGTILNDIARPMGFTFRDDLLFGFGASPFDQHYTPTRPSHPIVQRVPPMDFAVSCSIDPGNSHGRAVALNTGLWSMGPEYHNDNFHPFPQHCPEMRYGAFIQIWAAQYGQGRAVAFTDSTIFSNFCVFQPGKAELMLGMVEWLNHAQPLLDPRPWLLVLGFVSLMAGLWMARGRYLPSFLLLLASAACAWVVASTAVGAMHRWALPQPEALRPERCVVVDRTVSVAPLSKGPDTQGGGEGYGLLEQWIARLGCYTVRRSGPDAFSGDALVILCPNRSVTDEFRNRLVEYVAHGGRLLVLDSPENNGSTAHSLLSPFGLSIRHDRTWTGKLSTTDLLPAVDVAGANEVVGGQPVAKLDQYPVAATTRYGRGSVMAIGFGSLWNDKRMGEHWMLDPDKTTKARYEVLFALLRSWLDDRPLPTAPKPKKKPAADLPLEESGPAEIR